MGTHLQMRKLQQKKRPNCVSNPFRTKVLKSGQKRQKGYEED